MKYLFAVAFSLSCAAVQVQSADASFEEALSLDRDGGLSAAYGLLAWLAGAGF